MSFLYCIGINLSKIHIFSTVIDNNERKKLLGKGSILQFSRNSLKESILKPVIIVMIVFWI
jgi:hypothetical protein